MIYVPAAPCAGKVLAQKFFIYQRGDVVVSLILSRSAEAINICAKFVMTAIVAEGLDAAISRVRFAIPVV